MSTVVVPENMPEALLMLEGALGFLADMDSAAPTMILAGGFLHNKIRPQFEPIAHRIVPISVFIRSLLVKSPINTVYRSVYWDLCCGC